MVLLDHDNSKEKEKDKDKEKGERVSWNIST